MDPPLRERISWRTPMSTGVDVPASTASMARAGAALALAGAAVPPLGIILPHGPGFDETLAGLLGLGALALAAALLLLYDRIPPWGFHLVAVCATAFAAVGCYSWGANSVFSPMPYLWVVVYVCWFFRPPAAAVHVALMATSYAVVLSLEDVTRDSIADYVAVVFTLAVAAYLISRGRERVASLLRNLTDAVRRDPLTGLLNRRGFEEVFDLEIERCRRAETPLSLVVADIDRFKSVNDAHGHGAGDAALRKVGDLICRAKRRFDSAARVGGEEFAIVVPDTDEHGAYMLAERIRTSVDKDARLTLSLGVACSPLHGATSDALLQSADHALYAAKRLGRNRSVISSAEVPGILARGAAAGREHGYVEVGALVSLAESLDVRDSGHSAHCHRVGRFSELIARELGLAPDEVERIRLAGVLHDVGRVAVPEGVMEKSGPLTEEEWGWVRAHPSTGARLLETTDFADVQEWIRLHHERPDGAGYPEGLNGEAVPLEARILAVADAYEAMTSDRPYRVALGADEAAEELRHGAGTQFDERVVEALLRVV
jgi:diguanylate cyclase (GGDEF)-like protein